MITLAPGPCFTFTIVAPDGRVRLVERDQDFPGIAAVFGWPMPATITAENVWDAYQFLEDHIGSVADDPGYF